MDMNSVFTTKSRSNTIFKVGFVAAVLFLFASQIMQSVVIPAASTVPSPALIAIGATLTFFAFLSTLAMVYSMLLRRKGQ